jgi:hypothetical protein
MDPTHRLGGTIAALDLGKTRRHSRWQPGAKEAMTLLLRPKTYILPHIANNNKPQHAIRLMGSTIAHCTPMLHQLTEKKDLNNL